MCTPLHNLCNQSSIEILSHYFQQNPKGQVPMIRIDNGEKLTENAIILQYVSDIKPELGLMPKPGTMERYHAMEWLNFISTEIHKKFGPFFNPKSTEEQLAEAKKIIIPKYPSLTQFYDKMLKRPSVIKTMEMEGLKH